jgi:hypothetical protein
MFEPEICAEGIHHRRVVERIFHAHVFAFYVHHYDGPLRVQRLLHAPSVRQLE